MFIFHKTMDFLGVGTGSSVFDPQPQVQYLAQGRASLLFVEGWEGIQYDFVSQPKQPQGGT